MLYPTDTIWGIGCDPFNETSVRKIFTLKQRPLEKSFILLVDSINMLENYVSEISTETLSVLKDCKEPTSIIYTNTKNLPSYLLAKDKSIVIRVIEHPFITPLIQQLNTPLISTSANISGFESPKIYDDIQPEVINGVDLIMPKEMDVSEQDKPSRIVKVNSNGSLNWIRK